VWRGNVPLLSERHFSRFLAANSIGSSPFLDGDSVLYGPSPFFSLLRDVVLISFAFLPPACCRALLEGLLPSSMGAPVSLFPRACLVGNNVFSGVAPLGPFLIPDRLFFFCSVTRCGLYFWRRLLPAFHSQRPLRLDILFFPACVLVPPPRSRNNLYHRSRLTFSSSSFHATFFLQLRKQEPGVSHATPGEAVGVL